MSPTSDNKPTAKPKVAKEAKPAKIGLASAKAAAAKPSKPVKPHVCAYCNTGFTRESTLHTHVCEQKRRFLAKNDKHVVYGYQAFVSFFQYVEHSTAVKSYEEFTQSPYYNAFVKFGSFISNTRPLYIGKYIDWVVKSGVKLDHWCRDELYEKYVVDLVRTESVETALERSVTHMQTWADTTGAVWTQYFEHVSGSRATYDIKDGKVSPWLILNSPTGRQMVASLSDEQLNEIAAILDPAYWTRVFKLKTSDVELVKDIVREASL
jgi:hypothetical protein